MGSGINLPQYASLAYSYIGEARVIASSGINSRKYTPGVRGPWTPPQYSSPAVTVLSVPSGKSSTIYVFDAILRLKHSRTLKKSLHPVLTSASISDNAYVEPSRVVLEIGISDAMASFTSGVWVGSATKSISAWQILKQIQINRNLCTLITRLDTYYQMLITSLDTLDDNRTGHALRASISFEEQLTASVSSTYTSNSSTSSSRPQTTGNTSSGTVQSTTPNPQQESQNVIPSTFFPNVPNYSQVPGAGSVGSTSLGSVPA